MSNRGARQMPKSRSERDYYNRLIRQKDFEPTKSESMDFNESIDKGEDYSIQTASKPRRRSLVSSISEHVRENIAGYIISIVVGILFFFMIDSKIDLATIKEKLTAVDNKATRIEDELKEVETKVDNNYEKLHKQEIDIKGNSIRIENLKEAKAGNNVRTKKAR